MTAGGQVQYDEVTAQRPHHEGQHQVRHHWGRGQVVGEQEQRSRHHTAHVGQQHDRLPSVSVCPPSQDSGQKDGGHSAHHVLRHVQHRRLVLVMVTSMTVMLQIVQVV